MNDAPKVKKFSGAKITEARVACELTKVDLAGMVGCTDMSIYNWETGRFFPDAESLAELSAALGKPVEWFFVEME